MNKYHTMILLGVLVATLPLLGFPQIIRDILFAFFGLTIASLAYLSSVVYCSNCRLLVEDAGLPVSEESKQ